TLLWHHRLGHPSLPRLRGMHSRLLVSGLPKSLPPLPPWPAPPCLPCVEGRQCAAPHSSSFPLTTAPLQTLHMDVKGQVFDVLIPWIHVVRLQLRERFHQDLLVLRLHFDRGGEFSSDLLRDFCRGEGILQSFTLKTSHLTSVSQVHPLPGTATVEIAVGSGAAQGAASGGAEPGGAESEGAGSEGAEPGGEEPGGVEHGGAESEDAGSGGAEPRAIGAGGAGDAGAGARGAGATAGAGGTGGSAAAGLGGARTRGAGAVGTGGVGGAGAGDPTERGAAGAGGSFAGGAGAGGAGVGGTGVGGAGSAGAGAVDLGGGGPGGTVRPRPYFVPQLQKVLGVPSSTSLTPPLLCPPPVQSQPPLP
ncbi:unnamed protein product, partial [Closterium sp. NIES-53]